MPKIKKGLEGIVVSESKICSINGQKGELLYRGYNINDIAAYLSFEEVGYLLLFERLPNKKELHTFDTKLKKQRVLPKNTLKMMKLFCGQTPMEALRTVVSSLSCHTPDGNKVTREAHIKNAIDLIAKFPTIVASYYRLEHGKKPVSPSSSLNHGENFLYMITGKKPTATEARAINTDFVLHAEHSFNASTFAGRVAVSTLSDMYSALTASIGTLKGPLHGGAARNVMLMLRKIKTEKNIVPYVKKALKNHERIMGFGHRVYRTIDPRAVILKEMARALSEEKGAKWFSLCTRLEEVMAKEKGLYPNVDFYSSIVYDALGIPLELDTPIFAIGRSVGWSAHCLEQYDDNRLIRPRAHYTGPTGLRIK